MLQQSGTEQPRDPVGQEEGDGQTDSGGGGRWMVVDPRCPAALEDEDERGGQ